MAREFIERRPLVVVGRSRSRFTATNPKVVKNIYAHHSTHASVSPNLDAYWQDNEHHNELDFKNLTKSRRRKTNHAVNFAILLFCTRTNSDGQGCCKIAADPRNTNHCPCNGHRDLVYHRFHYCPVPFQSYRCVSHDGNTHKNILQRRQDPAHEVPEGPVVVNFQNPIFIISKLQGVSISFQRKIVAIMIAFPTNPQRNMKLYETIENGLWGGHMSWQSAIDADSNNSFPHWQYCCDSHLFCLFPLNSTPPSCKWLDFNLTHWELFSMKNLDWPLNLWSVN